MVVLKEVQVFFFGLAIGFLMEWSGHWPQLDDTLRSAQHLLSALHLMELVRQQLLPLGFADPGGCRLVCLRWLVLWVIALPGLGP